MYMVRSSFSFGSTCTEPLDFLDNKTSFYNMFGLVPDMLFVINMFSRTIEESVTLQSKLSTLCSRSQLQIFCHIVQLQYVGIKT